MNNTVTVSVVGNDQKVSKWFEDMEKISLSDNWKDADVVVFTGGGDIAPHLYGQKNIASSGLNVERDLHELEIFRKTKETAYHIGVCRGSQLLWVANGGQLWQDISGHAIHGTHDMKTLNGGHIKGVTSTHHQAAMITPEFGRDRLLAYTNFGVPVRVKAPNMDTSIDDIVEIHYHEDTRSLGIQGHPEYSSASAQYKKYIEFLLFHNKETRI